MLYQSPRLSFSVQGDAKLSAPVSEYAVQFMVKPSLWCNAVQFHEFAVVNLHQIERLEWPICLLIAEEPYID